MEAVAGLDGEVDGLVIPAFSSFSGSAVVVAIVITNYAFNVRTNGTVKVAVTVSKIRTSSFYHRIRFSIEIQKVRVGDIFICYSEGGKGFECCAVLLPGGWRGDTKESFVALPPYLPIVCT